MVAFEIESLKHNKAVYKYFPENNKDKMYGKISVQLPDGDAILDVAAEEDFLRRTSADELNEMRDTINQMRAERGEPKLTEEELPTATEDNIWYYYANHVINKINNEIKEGRIPEKGTVIWY